MSYGDGFGGGSGSGGGGVTSVTGTAPIVSSGGATPAISLAPSGALAGSYTSANITIGSDGRISAASNGSGGGATIGTYASRPASGTEFVATETGQRYVYTGGVWRPCVDMALGYEPPDPNGVGWSWGNQASSVLTYTNGRPRIASPAGTANTFHGRFFASGNPSTMGIRIRATGRIGAASYGYGGPHVAVRESATGKVVSMGYVPQALSSPGYVTTSIAAIQYTGSGATFSSSADYNPGAHWATNWIGLRVAAGVLIYEISIDGTNWETFTTQVLPGFFTTAPDEVGFGNFEGGIAVETTFYSVQIS